jgi:hypothetical protein
MLTANHPKLLIDNIYIYINTQNDVVLNDTIHLKKNLKNRFNEGPTPKNSLKMPKFKNGCVVQL